MDKLTKEDLLALLATKTDKPRKERKKVDLSEEKKSAMLERLAQMRETVKVNRDKKKGLEIDEVKVKEKVIDEVFEKKYGSKFEKMTDLLTDLNENTKEVVKMKKEKIAKREAIKLEVKEPVKPPAPTPTPAPAPAPEPVANNPKSVVQSNTHINPLNYVMPNRNIFSKGNTRF